MRERTAAMAAIPAVSMRSRARQPVPRLNPRRFEICMKAARIFVQKGFDATSVSDIAAALGVTKAGLYHHIESKEALLYDIVSLGMDWLDEDVIRPVSGIADPETRLEQILVRHATLTACNEGWITILLDDIEALKPPQRRGIEHRKRVYVEIVRNTLVELQRAGRLRPLDPMVAALGVLGMIVWLPRWVKPRRSLSCDQVARQIADIALAGLLLPPQGRTDDRP